MKLKAFLVVAIIFFFFSNCKSDQMKNKPPVDVIPIDTMINVMTDMMILENAIKTDFPQIVRDETIALNSSDSLLREYNMNYDRYERSLSYYLFDQDTMKYIYNQITDRVTAKMNGLEEN